MNYRESMKSHSKEELIGFLEDAARNWLAHDGLWFLAVEQDAGIEKAIELDAQAWRQFTVIEAKRIMERLALRPGGGIPALKQALGYRLYACLNEQQIIDINDHTLLFRMKDCRVQSARKRKQLPDFPCKPVGLVEYEYFAKTIDPRFETRCITCPPDDHPPDYYCAWEFTLND